jgi:hypothetical protein
MKTKFYFYLMISLVISFSCSKQPAFNQNNPRKSGLFFIDNGQLYYNSQICFNFRNLKPEDIYYGEYYDSLATYSSGDKYGYINIDNDGILIPARFDVAWNFDVESGLAAFVLDGKMGFINTKGEYVLKPTFPYNNDNYIAEPFIFENGLCFAPSASGKVGKIDTSMNLVIDTVFKYIQRQNEYFIVWFDDYECVLIDSGYRKIISDTCSDIEVTNIGFVVRDLDYTKLYLLDFDGVTVLCDNVFTGLEPISSVFQDSYEYNNIEIENHEYVAFYSVHNYYGLIESNTGKVISKYFFDDIMMLSSNVFVGKTDGYYFLFDQNGNFINK